LLMKGDNIRKHKLTIEYENIKRTNEQTTIDNVE
jgi:hypothetical protein